MLNPGLQQAARSLQIADVTLGSIDAYLAEDFLPELAGSIDFLVQTIRPSCRSIRQVDGMAEGLTKHRYIFEMYAGVRLVQPVPDHAKLEPDEIEKLVRATIYCTFFVSFETTPGSDELTSDAITKFGEHNAAFNMWPYWREVVQSACSRMGLPRIVLPSFRLAKSALAEPPSVPSLGRVDPE